MKNLIISHSADWDGMFGAAIALNSLGLDTKYHLMNYGDDTPYELLNDFDHIYMIDFTLPIDDLRLIAGKTTLIDHHTPKLLEINREIGVSAFEDYHINLDGTKSGAYLAWEFFNHNQKVPTIVNYVSIYDVFLKSSPEWQTAYEFQIGLRLHELSVNSALKLLRFSDSGLATIINSGITYLQYKKSESIKAFNDYSWDVHMVGREDYLDLRVKAILTSDMQSIFCEPILSSGDVDVIFMINRASDDTFKMSVRVSIESDFNAAEYCKNFGGGGHEKAAGCIIPFEFFRFLMGGVIFSV